MFLHRIHLLRALLSSGRGRSNLLRKLWFTILSALPIALVATAAHAHFLYALSSSSISGYKIDPSDGRLTPIEGSPFPAGQSANCVAVDPFGRFAYVTTKVTHNGETDPAVLGYTIDPGTGALTLAFPPIILDEPFIFASETSPMSGFTVHAKTGDNGLDIAMCVAVDPSGRFVYVSNWDSFFPESAIEEYAIDPTTGNLQRFEEGYCGNGPYSMAVDPSGKLYVTNFKSRDIWGYRIQPSGTLTPVAGSPFPTPNTQPRGGAVDPFGRFFYATNGAQQPYSVSGYKIDPGTGALAYIDSFAVVAAPFAVAVDPTGKFVYTANIDSSYVSGYKIDPSDGKLTPIEGSPFRAVDSTQSVAVDPDGRFVYMAGGGISGYKIDTITGALTDVPGSPFAGGGEFLAIVRRP